MRKHCWRSCALEQGSSFKILLPHTIIVRTKVPIWKQTKATTGLPAAHRSYCLRFFSVLKKDLEKELKGETSGDFAKLLLALLHVRVWLNNLYIQEINVYLCVSVYIFDQVKLIFCGPLCRQKEVVTVPVQRDIEVRFGIKWNIFETIFVFSAVSAKAVLCICIMSPCTVICKFNYLFFSVSLRNTKWEKSWRGTMDTNPDIPTPRAPGQRWRCSVHLFYLTSSTLLFTSSLLVAQLHCDFCSADGSGTAVRSGGEWDFGEEVYRGCSTGLESFEWVFFFFTFKNVTANVWQQHFS